MRTESSNAAPVVPASPATAVDNHAPPTHIATTAAASTAAEREPNHVVDIRRIASDPAMGSAGGRLRQNWNIDIRSPTAGPLIGWYGWSGMATGSGRLSRLRGDNGGSRQLRSMNLRIDA